MHRSHKHHSTKKKLVKTCQYDGLLTGTSYCNHIKGADGPGCYFQRDYLKSHYLWILKKNCVSVPFHVFW